MQEETVRAGEMRSGREEGKAKKRWDRWRRMSGLREKQESSWGKCIRKHMEADSIFAHRLSTSPRMCTCDL